MLCLRRLAEKTQAPFPSTEEAVETEVERLAKLLRKYGSAFLRGDQRAFEQVESLRRKAEQKLAEG
jgi:hypothetical protein